MSSLARSALAAVLLLAAPVVASDLGGFSVFAQRWDDLSDDDRRRAVKNFERYKKLNDKERRDVERRYEKWKNLPEGDRAQYRRKFKEYRGRGLLED